MKTCHNRSACASLCFVLVVCVAASAQTAAPSKGSAKFELVKVAEGVYAALRKEPPGFAVESNSVFIVGDSDVIVVDTQSNSAATADVLAALRGLTDKPVRYVVNTHWHDDHVIGNQVYAEAFPGVQFVAHAREREYLATTGLVNREKFHKAIPAFLSTLKALLRDNKNLRGEPLSEEERASYLSDVSLGEGYMTVPPGYQPLLPTVTLEDKLTLYQGARAVEILYLGRGHTSADIVVHLPREHVVVCGDLVVWPVPFVGGDQSHVGDWGATLEKMLSLGPATIIPGHGPLMRDDAYVRLMIRLMSSLKRQALAAVARGETLEQARKEVSLEEFRKLFAGDSKVRNALFSTYVVGPAVESAFRDASVK